MTSLRTTPISARSRRKGRQGRTVAALAVSMAFFLSSCTGTSSSGVSDPGASHLDEILKAGVLRVGTTGDFPPISVKQPDGTYEGMDIKLMETLAKEMGVKLVFVDTDWKNLVAGLEADRYDITTSASVTAERLKAADFTENYFTTYCVPLVQKADANKYTSWEAVNDPGVKVAAVLGTTYSDMIKRVAPNAKHQIIEPPGTAYQAAISEQADVALTSDVEASAVVKANPSLVIASAPPIPIGDQSLLVPRNDQDWLNYVNRWLATKKKLGVVDELQNTYMRAK